MTYKTTITVNYTWKSFDKNLYCHKVGENIVPKIGRTVFVNTILKSFVYLYKKDNNC